MKSKFQYLLTRISFLLSYPLHYSILYGFAKVFGNLKSKIYHDVFRLPHYAFCIYTGAQRAKESGFKKITVIEFGVANGRGLIAMGKYASQVSKEFNIDIEVLGFDSGEGMPVDEGYKDHPEIYTAGDYPMQQTEKLRSILPKNTKLILLNLNNENWTQHLSQDSPIGFISIDVDYYSSTKNILNHLHTIDNRLLLPNTLFYFDDILADNHNDFQGELLAIHEFNSSGTMRKFDSFSSRLRNRLFFYNSSWRDQI